MIGKVIDMNNTEAFVSFENGTTTGVSKFSLPQNVKIDPNATRLTNDKLVDFF